MLFDLTPTELTALRDTGEVRVVREMGHQPQQTLHDDRVWVYDGDLYAWGNPPMFSKEFVDAASPFPPAGTREVIDGIACVWGEVDCVEMTKPKLLDDGSKVAAAYAGWHWIAHIRKDTE